MTRLTSRALQTAIDVALLVAAFGLAFLLRFDWEVPTAELRRWGLTVPYVVALQYSVLMLFAVPRFAWRYVGLRETTRIFYAMATSAAVLVAIRIAAALVVTSFRPARHAIIPIGVLAIDFIVASCAIVGVRMLRRVAAERAGKLVYRERQGEPVRTMLIGAGQGGMMVAREIEARPDLGIDPVGFVDDAVVKVGSMVHGVPVLGTTSQLKELCRKRAVQQALITIPAAAGKDIRRIVRLCDESGIRVKIVPGLHEIVGGRVNLSRLRNVAIEDLLRREPVKLDEDAISDAVRGGVVLVTGAGGSIGSELCRQVCRFAPERLVLVERAENNLFNIHRELADAFPDVELVPCIADVCDQGRMVAVFSAHLPRFVFHAAAHKHVPMMEWNPGEAVKNNLLGTRCLANVADRYGVEKFVMISTDKAVNPTSMMGATKRVAEIYIQALSQRSKTRFVTVRFGNVLGSAGSVVPIFQEQIALGGPVTITHPDMKRYFMTIPEASQLVLQAATMGRGGEIFILDMGEPVRIVDLAHDLIRLSGLRPGEDIEVQITGVRPGEKLFEELSALDENANKTRHPKIFIGRLQPYPWSDVLAHMDALERLANGADFAALRSRLCEAVPEYHPESERPPISSIEQPGATPLVAALHSAMMPLPR